MDNIGTILGVLLGVGGTGGLGSLYLVIRAHKKGKIEDEGTLIERINNDNKSQHDQRKAAEERADKAVAEKNAWMGQAIAYRMQLVSANPPIQPADIQGLWPGMHKAENS